MAIGKKTAEDSVCACACACARVCGVLPHSTDTLIKTVNKNKKVNKKMPTFSDMPISPQQGRGAVRAHVCRRAYAR